ncbi:MAG: STAS domain-containing protein [Pirellulaceae bacterium]
MQLSIHADDGKFLRMRLVGRVTQKELPAQEDLFVTHIGADAYRRRVLLNMEDSEFLDSSGVSWLLVAHKRFRDQGGRLVLHSLPPMVSNVLKVLRMNQILTLAETEQAALKLLEGDAT